MSLRQREEIQEVLRRLTVLTFASPPVRLPTDRLWDANRGVFRIEIPVSGSV
jgi:hypothetical protein